MYIYNEFIFGHQLSIDKELNNDLCDYDIEYQKTINGKKFEIDFPYHGGQVNGDTYSCVFGVVITDNDGNPNFIDEVRNSKEEDYLSDYNIFITSLIKDINDNRGLEEDEEMNKDYENFANRLIEFLQSNKPKFYEVELSS